MSRKKTRRKSGLHLCDVNAIFFFKSLLHTFWPPCLQIWIYNEKALFQNFRNQQLFCAFTIFRTWHSPDRLIKTQVLFLTLCSLKRSSMIDGSFRITQWSAKVYKLKLLLDIFACHIEVLGSPKATYWVASGMLPDLEFSVFLCKTKSLFTL